MDNLSIPMSVKTSGNKIFTPVTQPYTNPAEIRRLRRRGA